MIMLVKADPVNRSHSQGGPTVDWSIIQPKLGQVKAEILLLFDCCFAAQAARAHPVQAIPANVELLAACAMGVKTRPPGPHSFTTHLIKQLRASLKSNGSAKISNIANILAHRDSGCRETPVHFSGLGGGRSTVCLEPFESSPAINSHRNKEVAWLTLKVSLRDMLSETLINEVVQWLKAHPTRKISKLTIEKVVQSANNVASFIYEDRAPASGPKFNQFSETAKQDVLTAWDNFKSLLAGLATQLRSQYAFQGRNVQDLDLGAGYSDARLRGPLANLLEIEERLLSLQDVVQRSIMALPDLNEKRESLLEAIEDPTMQDLGSVPLLTWRLNARFPSDTDSKTDHLAERTPTELDVFRNLVKEDFHDVGGTLVEYKFYDKGEITFEKMKDLEQRIQILADILETRGPPDFHSLRCTNWFHDEKEKRFGLVFEYPEGYSSFASLREIIETTSTNGRPTLAQRFLIVKIIGEALLKWHVSANWVHQGVASHNIYFFKPKNSASYDYTCPFLCGFEFARPSNAISLSLGADENFEQRMYHHPDRLAIITTSHTKQHDLYSYGILLLEVGLWTLVRDCFGRDLTKRIPPKTMGDIIRTNARRRLDHFMGAAYRKAAIRCLDMDFAVELDDAVGTNLAKAFKDLVLEEIEPGTRLD